MMSTFMLARVALIVQEMADGNIGTNHGSRDNGVNARWMA